MRGPSGSSVHFLEGLGEASPRTHLAAFRSGSRELRSRNLALRDAQITMELTGAFDGTSDPVLRHLRAGDRRPYRGGLAEEEGAPADIEEGFGRVEGDRVAVRHLLDELGEFGEIDVFQGLPLPAGDGGEVRAGRRGLREVHVQRSPGPRGGDGGWHNDLQN